MPTLNCKMIHRLLLLVFAALLNPYNAKAANILVVLPLAYYSHYSGFQPVLQALASRGHNVTVVSPYPQKTPVPNITDIVVPKYLEMFMASSPKDILELKAPSAIMFLIWEMGARLMEEALQTEQIQRLIQSAADTKFDLIITETGFAHELFVAFGHKFMAPVINLFPELQFPSAAYLTGNHFPTTYIPYVKTDFPSRMCFMERIKNTFYYWFDIIIGQVYYLRLQEALLDKYFIYPGSENRPSLQDMLRNTSLTLLDIHFTIGYPTPMHKNLVPYGGGYLQKPGKLPKDLQELMDNTKEGIIFFSFGSGTTISSLRPELQHAILSALSKVKLTVLMRLKEPTLPTEFSNKNIIIREWFPQAAILAHPNCKLFITHCGIHGIMEAVFNAVPMVALPMIADQNYNSLFLESAGIAYRVLPEEITEQKLLTAINAVLTEPRYQENIKKRSAIFKDNPMDIMDHAIYWIEYVIRHRGAPHLRPAVLDQHWYQRLMLDVFAFYLFAFLTLIIILYLVMKISYRCLYFMVSSIFVRKNKRA